MPAKTESSTLVFFRSLALGVLVSMAFMYAVHVFGTWTVENYRPNEDTTYTLLLHNRCAVFGNEHTLHPGTGTATTGPDFNGTKLAGSFLLFSEGHVLAMVVIALVLGGAVFALRRGAGKQLRKRY